jgi:hypothetical protein
MAMLPEGFTPNIVLDGSPKNYESSNSGYGTHEARGGAPRHQPEGYKLDFSGVDGEGKYTPDLTDAAKGSEKVPGDKTVTLVTKDPANYSRDWSGK